MGIAKHAGIGSASCYVFVNEVLDNEITKLLADVKNIVSKTMFHGCLAGIIETVDIATSCLFFTASAGGIVPGFHGNPYHLIPFIIEHQGSNGTVDTPAHCHQNFSFTTHNCSKNCKLQIYDEELTWGVGPESPSIDGKGVMLAGLIFMTQTAKPS